jgi:hypothetical protein
VIGEFGSETLGLPNVTEPNSLGIGAETLALPNVTEPNSLEGIRSMGK